MMSSPSAKNLSRKVGEGMEFSLDSSSTRKPISSKVAVFITVDKPFCRMEMEKRSETIAERMAINMEMSSTTVNLAHDMDCCAATATLALARLLASVASAPHAEPLGPLFGLSGHKVG